MTAFGTLRKPRIKKKYVSFLSDDLHNKGFKLLEESYKDPMMEMHLLFSLNSKHGHFHRFQQIFAKRRTLDIKYLPSLANFY